MRTRFFQGLLVLLLAVQAARSQPKFEAAIRWAYDLKDYQVSGPSWMSLRSDVERYEVLAKAERAAVPQRRLMLQTLLADRFQPAVHRGSAEMQAHGLVLAKGGPELELSQDQDAPSKMVPRGRSVRPDLRYDPVH